MSQTLKIFIAIIITVIIIGGGFYFWQEQKQETPQPSEETSPVVDIQIQPAGESSNITILVPEDYELYKEQMIEFVQAGGSDPLETIDFIEKEIIFSYSDDIVKASAQAAAEEIAPSGGPAKASISSLKIKDGTAYVLLDIDLDGWAGVSVSQAIIHPLVERTLMQFPEINKVVFDYCPEDK